MSLDLFPYLDLTLKMAD